MQYTFKKISPCAEYDGYTIEGHFSETIPIKLLLESAKNILDNVILLSNSDIIIAKSSNYEIYIYDSNSFVISRIKNELEAHNLIKNLFKNIKEKL